MKQFSGVKWGPRMPIADWNSTQWPPLCQRLLERAHSLQKPFCLWAQFFGDVLEVQWRVPDGSSERKAVGSPRLCRSHQVWERAQKEDILGTEEPGGFIRTRNNLHSICQDEDRAFLSRVWQPIWRRGRRRLDNKGSAYYSKKHCSLEEESKEKS